MAEEMFTIEEVAKHLKLSIRTVRDYVREKKIKGVKVGKEWRVPDSDLQAYIEELKTKRDSTAQ